MPISPIGLYNMWEVVMDDDDDIFLYPWYSTPVMFDEFNGLVIDNWSGCDIVDVLSKICIYHVILYYDVEGQKHCCSNDDVSFIYGTTTSYTPQQSEQ